MLRGHSGKHDIGKDTLLDAEGAAGIRRRAQTQAIARHLERTGDDRVDRKRPLEIRRDVEGIFAGIVFRNHAVGFDRRAGIAGIGDPDRDGIGRGLEGRFRLAVAKAPFVGEVDPPSKDEAARFRFPAPIPGR